jgi:hypothetical protein
VYTTLSLKGGLGGNGVMMMDGGGVIGGDTKGVGVTVTVGVGVTVTEGVGVNGVGVTVGTQPAIRITSARSRCFISRFRS